MRPVSNDIYTFNEVFAEEVYGLIRRRLPDIRTVIDLGANIGLSSIYFLAHYPAARALAVEPDPQNYILLTENLASYVTQKRATVVQGALWASDGPVIFERPSAPGHVNQGAVVGPVAGDASDRQFVVPGWTMPTLMTRAGFDRVDLLKVDIEGGEEHLFTGDASWLDRVGCLAVEFHNETRQKSRFDDRVREFGFTVEDANAHTVVAVRHQRGGTT
jgi:FkbM family methyltransferase